MLLYVYVKSFLHDCFIKFKISSAVGSLLFFSNPLKNSSHFWLYSLDFSAVATVADRPRQVNKIIGCLQVFQGILFSPLRHSLCSRHLPSLGEWRSFFYSLNGCKTEPPAPIVVGAGGSVCVMLA